MSEKRRPQGVIFLTHTIYAICCRALKRTSHIIFNFTHGTPFTSMLYATNIDTLASRRNEVSQKFLQDITQPPLCLHCLLSALREQSVILSLRTSIRYSRVYTRINRYCSFSNHALNNYQDRTGKIPGK